MSRLSRATLIVFLAACGDDDGGMDASVDASLDVIDVDSAGDVGLDAPSDAGPPPEVEVTYDHGTVVGRTIDGVDWFLALPYAAPPVGDLRFRPPAAVTPWTEPRDASEPPETCAQVNVLAAATEVSGSEDCLYLNVFSPDVTASDLPVYLWIHGGAFIAGSGGRSPSAFARGTGHIVVTINYRLDELGFLAHSALTAEGATGNYGLLDQRAAMEWVRDHIEAFGGDPDNVTIAGESAGGISVALHALSPGSDGLFHRAVVQSGPPDLLPLPTLEQAQTRGESFASSVGCADVDTAPACLRALSVDELVLPTPIDAEPGGIFYQSVAVVPTPNIDGVVLPESPADALAGGRFSDVPYLIGSNGDEGTLFHGEALSELIENEAEYRTALGARYPDDVDAIVAAYPVASYDDANAALTAVTSDQFNCATREYVRLLADGGASVWLYAFEAVPEGLFVRSLGLNAYHSAELVFLFDLDDTLLGKVADADRDLQAAMYGFWGRFVATGDPNGGDEPAWPAYATSSDAHMLLVTPPTAGSGYLESVCDFWADITPTVMY